MPKPQVLVLAGPDAMDAVAAAGFALAGDDTQRRQTAAIVIEARGEARSRAPALMRSIRAALGPRAGLFFAWTGTGEMDPPEGFDGTFPADTPPSFIAARLGSAIRIAVMGDEAQLRFETLSRFGGARIPPVSVSRDAPRVLLHGPPGPEAMAMAATLEAMGAHTVAALTSFSAFDYLHESPFDAVVVIARDDRGGALSFCAALRRNARLFHLPCLIAGSPDFDDPGAVISRGASDFCIAGQEDEAAALRLLSLADEKRRREALALAFAAARAPAAMDPGTGLYGREFFAEHLARLAHRAGETDRPLSVAVARLVPQQPVAPRDLDRLVGQSGAMLGRLVRAEDVAARLDRTTYAVAFPASDAAAARVAAERIAAVLECTAFDGADRAAVTVRMDVASGEIGSGGSVAQVLRDTLASLPEARP